MESTEEEVKARTKKSLIRLLVMCVIGLPIICGVLPQRYKNRVLGEAEAVIKMNQLTPIETYGDYSYIYEHQDYIVERLDGTIDTIGVCFNRGNVELSITLDTKKGLPGKTFGL